MTRWSDMPWSRFAVRNPRRRKSAYWFAPGCRERLKAADVFVAAMTSAAAEIREAEKS
jgi:hypothetical protein